MATLRDIRRRIGAVKSTAKITQAMRMVSAAKLRRAQKAIISARPFVDKLNILLSNLIEAVSEDYSHPLIEQRKQIKNIALIVVASDRGFCGGFNTNINKFAKNFANVELSKKFPDARIHLIPIGRRSVNFFRKESFELFSEYPGIFKKLEFTISKEIAGLISSNFIEGNFDKVFIFYNAFKNLISQVPTQKQLLPIIAQQGRSTEKNTGYNFDYIFEPDQKSILDSLLPTDLNIQVWRSLLESAAAEEAARMMAMETATNNANDLIKHLELVYNKERQSSITKEMLEIVSGAESLRKA